MAISYRREPVDIPITRAQKMNAISRVSFMMLRKRMIDSAPIRPTATMKLPAMVAMTMETTTVIRIIDWTKDLEYDRPLWV